MAIDLGPKLFDRRRQQFEIKTPHPDYPSGKLCQVRFPTDDEWCRRQEALTTVYKRLGRDRTTTETPDVREANAALFDLIVVSQDAEHDEAEKHAIVSRLERCEVVGTSNKAGAVQVIMKVLGGVTVTHELRIPTQKQMMDYGRNSVSVVGRRFGSEMKVNYEPTLKLWNELVRSVSGYRHAVDIPRGDNDLPRENGAGGVVQLSSKTDMTAVPITHMDVALTEVLAVVQQMTEDDFDPEG
jgi:hypothetical protein